jgi:glycosyltransferase involved in cell wall biosynthesis
VRGGDAVTVVAPHAAGLPARWQDAGVEVRTFRYAPARAERLGYGRSLEADERVRGAALAVAPLYALAARRAVRRLLARRRFDLYQAHWLVPNAVAAPGRPRRTPFAVGLHGSDVFLAERPPYRAAARRALARARLLTGCSPELVERVCALGFPAERARVIPYGVDVAAFAPDGGRGRWRVELGVPENAPLVLAVGRLATKKGFHVLMQAAPAVLASQPDAHLVIAGDPHPRPADRAFAAELPPLAERLGVRDAVHLIGFARPGDVFGACDVFVNPARFGETFGRAAMEALVAGCPVVSTRVGAVEEVLEDERHALLVPSDRPEAMASAVRRLLGDPDLARRLAEQGGRHVRSSYTTERQLASFGAAIRRALASNGGMPQ